VIPTAHVMILAALLFSIGLAGATMRRNMIVVLMSIELMLNSVNVTLIAVARALTDVSGHVFVFFSLSVAAAEVAVGLAIVVAVYRSFGSVNMDDVSAMHG